MKKSVSSLISSAWSGKKLGKLSLGRKKVIGRFVRDTFSSRFGVEGSVLPSAGSLSLGRRKIDSTGDLTFLVGIKINMQINQEQILDFFQVEV